MKYLKSTNFNSVHFKATLPTEKNQISFSFPSELQRQIHGGQDHRMDTGELGFETRQLD